MRPDEMRSHLSDLTGSLTLRERTYLADVDMRMLETLGYRSLNNGPGYGVMVKRIRISTYRYGYYLAVRPSARFELCGYRVGNGHWDVWGFRDLCMIASARDPEGRMSGNPTVLKEIDRMVEELVTSGAVVLEASE